MKKTNHRIEINPPSWYFMRSKETPEQFIERATRDVQTFFADHKIWGTWIITHVFDVTRDE